MDPELRHLRYFVAVAEEASFTAAARRVHVTQQVLSAQIRQLEDGLGVMLLHRTSRGVQLTDAGRAFLVGARDTLRALNRASASARAHADATLLRVGLNVAATGEVPTATMASFSRRHPDVRVQWITFDLRHPAAGLLDGSSDVAFVRPPVDAPSLEFRALTREARVAVLPSGHVLASRPQLTLADLADQPWVAAAEAIDGCAARSWRDDWLLITGAGPAQRRVGAVAATVDEWREYVVAGLGLSLCPASAQTHYARPGLTFMHCLDAPPTTLALAWRTSDLPPAAAALVALLDAEHPTPTPNQTPSL